MEGVFEGIKVCEFSWAGVGPITMKPLADFGATVVRVESIHRPCITRTSPPFKDMKPGVNRSAMFNMFNENKYSMALNLNHPRAVEVTRKLVAWADIVADSFIPGTMEKWGLGWKQIQSINPKVILYETCSQGQTGPHARLPGVGMTLTAISGFTYLTGFPDREPSQPFGPYTDFLAPRLATTAIIAALDYRHRTGKGQRIDVSQYEAAIHFITPAILDYTANRNVAGRVGNKCLCAAPHNAYRCKGDERWCAIAVFTDEEWRAFRHVFGDPPWTREERFSTLLNRKQNEEELDRLIEVWTINFDAEEIMAMMQSALVGAGVVMNGGDLFNNDVVRDSFFWEVDHPEIGSIRVFGPEANLSKTPAQLRMPPPCLGEHTQYICEQFLNMSDAEFSQLLQEGVFE